MDEVEGLLRAIFSPHDIGYFHLPVYLHFKHGPFHALKLRREWDVERLREDLANKLMRSEIERDHERSANRGELTKRLLFRLSDGVFCGVEHSALTVYASTPAIAEDFMEKLAREYGKAKPSDQPSFYMLSASSNHVDVEYVNLTRPSLLSESDLSLHYGPDAVEFERRLIESLRGQTGGTTILRGEPGTGKTSFVRHLISKLQSTHRFYYLPLSATRYLASPDMVEFWLRQTRLEPEAKKIVVLEDAEDLLVQRGPDNRDKVSSLLNVSDGLLGEFLQMHLLCTINCPIERLDPAIVRPGRLLACREFTRLSGEQAQKLAEAKGLKLPANGDYSLAEIYRFPVIGSSATTQKSMGFAA